MPDLLPPLPDLAPGWWVALAVGALVLVTALVVAADHLADALGERAWIRVAVFVLALLAALGLVLLLATTFDLIPPFPF